MNSNSNIFLEIINEIERCLSHEEYLAALALSLTIPDICGKAENPELKAGERYCTWYDTYMTQYQESMDLYGSDMPYLSGEVVYKLRCNFLHTGNPNIDKEEIKNQKCKIDHFTLLLSNDLLGDTSHVGYGAGMKIVERGYSVNVRLLCTRVCNMARKYYADNKEKFNFFQYDLERKN